MVSPAVKKIPDKLISFPCFLCFLKGQVSLLQLLSSLPANSARDAGKASADLSYYTKMSGQDQLLPGTHLHSQPMQMPLKGPL